MTTGITPVASLHLLADHVRLNARESLARALAEADQLDALADALEARDAIPASMPYARQRPKRTSKSATPEERKQQSRERWALYGRWNTLWMEVGDGKGKLSFRFFAEYHHLTNTRNGSEISRWLSSTGRGVADGSPFDNNIRRVLTDGIRDLEAKKAAREADAAKRAEARAARAPTPNGSINPTIQSTLNTY